MWFFVKKGNQQITNQYNMKQKLIIPAILFLIIMGFLSGCNNRKAITNSYTIEAINDSMIFKYPNPKPVHVVEESFAVSSKNHVQHIPVTSTHLHNISVTIENTGKGVIENPYLFNAEEYDYRSLSKLTQKIVEGETNSFKKFMRIHEWFTYHYDKYGRTDSKGYNFDDYRGNPYRLINQYGGSLCGESVQTACGLLHFVPPMGSMYGRKIQMDGHQTGEVWFDGSWHNFDMSPEIRWVYFEEDNTTIVPHWKELRDNGGYLIKRIKPMTGWDIWSMVEKASCKPYPIITKVGKQWNFYYNLKPSEKITMNFDMKGRTDKVSVDYSQVHCMPDNPEESRKPCDYASAVFTYKPDFTTKLHKKYALEEKNIRWTDEGIEPANPGEAAYIVFPVKSTWCFVGANIDASFYKNGELYFAVNPQIGDTSYPQNPKWQLLKPGSVFENNAIGIEGRMAFWVKFQFKGKGSGLKNAAISSEVQMGRYTMPGLKFGMNDIRFTADNMNGSQAKITYVYDDSSKYDYYEPATANYGRHIYYRVGGNHIKYWTKPLFYKNIKKDPNGTIPIKVEIFKVSGKGAGKRVRLLKDEPLKYGTYWWYWDGKDDNGKICPVGMYAYKVTGEVGEGIYHQSDEFGERLYLFDHIWPVPNETRHSAEGSVKLIFDTDIAHDWDDVGALAVLHGLANLGEVKILGMAVAASDSGTRKYAPQALDIINTYYNRPDIPIGVCRPKGVDADPVYTKDLVLNYDFPSDIGTNVPDAVELYRKILSEQPDSSVVFLSVGMLTNMKDLLNSKPDQYSNLNGFDLVARKVKLWVAMGGTYPEGESSNFDGDKPTANYVVENWPGDVLFVGRGSYEFLTGGTLPQTPAGNPVRIVYELMQKKHNKSNIEHGSADLAAVIAAVRNPYDYWDVQTGGKSWVTYYGEDDWQSYTHWKKTPGGKQSYLISGSEKTEVLKKLINDLMTMPPQTEGGQSEK